MSRPNKARQDNQRTRKYRARKRHHTRSLAFEKLCSRRLLAVVSWDGDADDLLWSNPLNWSDDKLPNEADDVVIEFAAERPIVYDDADLRIRSLHLDGNLEVRSGQLHVSDGLNATQGNELVVIGNSASLHAETANVNGVGIFVSEGGRANIGATKLLNTSGDVYLRASGVGSILTMPLRYRYPSLLVSK